MNAIFGWLLEKVKDYVIKNWKTTVLGVVGAALSRYITDPATREAILAAVIAGIGLLAKDGDKSGTTALPRESVQPGPVAAPVPDAVIITETEAARVERIQTGP